MVQCEQVLCEGCVNVHSCLPTANALLGCKAHWPVRLVSMPTTVMLYTLHTSSCFRQLWAFRSQNKQSRSISGELLVALRCLLVCEGIPLGARGICKVPLCRQSPGKQLGLQPCLVTRRGCVMSCTGAAVCCRHTYGVCKGCCGCDAWYALC